MSAENMALSPSATLVKCAKGPAVRTAIAAPPDIDYGRFTADFCLRL
jgi:hypothetical protein